MNLSKINYKLIGRLRNLAKTCLDNGDYLGSFLLKFILLEGTVAHIVAMRVTDKPQADNDTISKFEQSHHFINLIDYFYLLTSDIKAYKELGELNKRRNKIVHEIFEYQTYDQILQEARELSLKIEGLDQYLLNTYWPKAKDSEPKINPPTETPKIINIG